MTRLLLISNSTAFGEGYLDHCMAEMLTFLDWVKPGRALGFVPFAVLDRVGYGEVASARFAAEGVRVEPISADAAGHETLARPVVAPKLPSPFPSETNICEELSTVTTSGIPSAFRSPSTMNDGRLPLEKALPSPKVPSPVLRKWG